MSITADMIESFTDTEGICMQSYPCQHGPFEIVLKNKTKVSAYLSAIDIYSVLKALNDIGVVHKDWDHFSHYGNSKLQELGWKIRPASEILTKIFEKSAN